MTIFLFVGTNLWSQFVDVNVELDMRRLSEGDRQLFESLKEDLESYYLNTQFLANSDDLNMAIDLHLVLESVFHGGNQITINAQAIFSNKLDQYFYAKSIQFPYERGRKMYYTTTFEPLASFLDYYAFMFIASELDTYEYMGGTTFFNRAIELANLGKDSDWSNNWDNRWKKARKLKGNEYLRSMRYNYFAAMDALSAEKVDINIVRDSMKAFFEDLETLDKKLGSDKETLHFLKTYHNNIAELLSALKMREALNLLKFYGNPRRVIHLIDGGDVSAIDWKTGQPNHYAFRSTWVRNYNITKTRRGSIQIKNT